MFSSDANLILECGKEVKIYAKKIVSSLFLSIQLGFIILNAYHVYLFSEHLNSS